MLLQLFRLDTFLTLKLFLKVLKQKISWKPSRILAVIMFRDFSGANQCLLKMQKNYIARVSHPEPGMKASEYFKDLREKFSAQVSEIVDQLMSV